MGTGNFFTKDDEDICEHHAAVEDRWNTDPVFALNKRIYGCDIEWTVKDNIQPNGVFPPLWTCHQQRIKRRSIIMDHFHHWSRGPERLCKMRWVGNDKLFNIYDISDDLSLEFKAH